MSNFSGKLSRSDSESALRMKLESHFIERRGRKQVPPGRKIRTLIDCISCTLQKLGDEKCLESSLERLFQSMTAPLPRLGEPPQVKDESPPRLERSPPFDDEPGQPHDPKWPGPQTLNFVDLTSCMKGSNNVRSTRTKKKRPYLKKYL